MSYSDRERQIIELLLREKQISTASLAERLYVSEPTVRRDIRILEGKGLITKRHGGCILNEKKADETVPFLFREHEQDGSKAVIAKKAAELISDGDVLFLDASTSAYSVIPYLGKFKNIIVITSGARASVLLAEMNITSICTGGNMLAGSLSYVGEDALRTVSRYNADLCFFSCRGLSENGQLSDSSVEENNVRREMMKHSKRNFFLCSGAKFGKVYLNNLCTSDHLDGILSEAPLPPGVHTKGT